MFDARQSGNLIAREIPAHELHSISASAARAKRFVGSSPLLDQAEAIVRGQTIHANDIRLPGMVFGRVLRAPASPKLASRPVSWDEATARRINGSIQMVEDPLLVQRRSVGLGILAATPGALKRISAALAVQPMP